MCFRVARCTGLCIGGGSVTGSDIGVIGKRVPMSLYCNPDSKCSQVCKILRGGPFRSAGIRPSQKNRGRLTVAQVGREGCVEWLKMLRKEAEDYDAPAQAYLSTINHHYPRRDPMLIRCVVYQDGRKLADIDASEIHNYIDRPECFVWVALFEPDFRALAQMQREFNLHPLAI